MSNGLRRRDMRGFQKWGVRQITDNEITILAWLPGAGKSVTSLTAMDDCLEYGIVKRVLIVAPMLVARATFPDEFSDWEHLNHVEYCVLRAEDEDEDVIVGRQRGYRFVRDVIGLDAKEAARWANRHKTKVKEWKRRRLADNGYEVHIINKEGLNWLWKHFDEGKRWPYDMVIVDEASLFKNGRKRTAKKELSQFGVMAKARKFCKRIVLMTGTPSPKGLINLWGLAYIADLGERLGTSRSKFEQRWFDSDYMGWNLTPKPHAHEQITERLSDIMFSLDDGDYPELPPLIHKEVKVRLSDRLLDEYDRFERTLVSQMYDVEAVNSGVLTGKLLQFASGGLYKEDGKVVHVHDEKLVALEDIIEDANGEPVLVFYNFKFDLARIRKRFKNAVVFGEGDVRKTKAAWNRGEIDLMLAHPQSVGHGQNIQFGGNISVWFSPVWDLELYQQACARLHRPGQTRPVTNHHIIARHTYDEKMLPLLQGKAQTQDSIIRAFRRHMGAVS